MVLQIFFQPFVRQNCAVVSWNYKWSARESLKFRLGISQVVYILKLIINFTKFLYSIHPIVRQNCVVGSWN